MATNPYFNSFNNGITGEQNLHQSLIDESIRMYGFDVYYLPRDVIEIDDILNEPNLSKFEHAYKIEMYLTELEGFEGEDFLSKFGMTIADQCTLAVSVRRWNELAAEQPDDLIVKKPHEGDLVYVPFAKALFEIRFVEDQSMFFPLGKLPLWELRCELFTAEDQTIDIAVDDAADDIIIDQIERHTAYVTSFNLTDVQGEFIQDENVTMTTPAGVTILARYINTININNIAVYRFTDIGYPDGKVVQPVAGTTITAGESGTTATVEKLIGLAELEYEEASDDDYQDNDDFETSQDEFLNFDEDNPFGDI
jgi:hypothetical protein